MRRVVAPVLASAVFLSACTGLSVGCGDVQSEYERTLSRAVEALETGQQREADGDMVGRRASVDAFYRNLELTALLVRDNGRCFDAGQRAWAEQSLRESDRRGAS